jgi:hypothetical protein
VKRCAVFVALALALSAPGSALADPLASDTDPAAAQSLFYDARALMAARRFEEACPKLEESLRLDAGIGTQFNLADCNEQLGKVTSAWAGFLAVAAQSRAANQHDRERLARKRAAALEPRLPRLVIDATGVPGDGLEVQRDGSTVGAAAWGAAIPVDPGTHRISASAPGKETWAQTVQATEGATARVAVPRDLASGVGPQAVAKRGATQRTLGWLSAGLGAAAVGVGLGFGLSSLGSRNDSRSHCTADACDAAGLRLRADAISSGSIATIASIAGGAAVAGGLVLVLTAPPGGPSSHEPAGRVRAAPIASIGGGGLMLQGVFR